MMTENPGDGRKPAPEPVRYGTADQLARLAHFAGLEDVQPEELDEIAYWLIGGPGVPLADRQACWQRIQTDCNTLWHCITDDYEPELDLDELPEDLWRTEHFATAADELERRLEITVERLRAEIEHAVWLSRYCATEARRTAVTR